HTFNAKAAQRLMRHYPRFSEIVYFPTSEAVMQAALRGDVMASCGQGQTSRDGFHVGMQARIAAPGSRLYSVAEIAQAYHCSLLGKPGARLEQVRLSLVTLVRLRTAAAGLNATCPARRSRSWKPTRWPLRARCLMAMGRLLPSAARIWRRSSTSLRCPA